MPTHATGMPRLRAFSAKTIGNRPRPASRPTGGTPRSLFTVIGHSDMLLDFPQLATNLRQLLERHQDSLLFPFRRRRRPQHPLVRRHVLGDAGLGADRDAVADVYVIGNADLAGDHHVITGAAGAGDAHLAN